MVVVLFRIIFTILLVLGVNGPWENVQQL